MTILAGSLIFADSNVFIEGLFFPDSSASLVIKVIATGTFNLATCQPVIRDVENAILNKLKTRPNHQDIVLQQWHSLQKRVRLTVLPAPPLDVVQETYNKYIALMRHKADIEILAAALLIKPAAILSRNREHFNDEVAAACGIPIFACAEFMELLKL